MKGHRRNGATTQERGSRSGTPVLLLDGWPDYSCQWRNPIPSSLGVEHHVKEYPATTSLIFVVVGKLAGLLGYEDARRSCL